MLVIIFLKENLLLFHWPAMFLFSKNMEWLKIGFRVLKKKYCKLRYFVLILYSSGAASKDRHIHNFRKAGGIAWWLRTGFYRIRVRAAVPGIGTQDDRSMVFTNCFQPGYDQYL
jgi:hypothetical protein